MNSSKVKKKTAFSLLELSVVVVIIGILVAGIVQSGNMIRVSRLNTARSITAISPVTNISGLIAWYETSSMSSFLKGEAYDSTNLSTWYDISPNSVISSKNTLTKTAGSNTIYQSSGINKIPSIKFNGTSSSSFTLSSFYQGSLTQTTIFLVFEPLSSSMGVCLFDSYGSGNGTSICVNSNSVNLNASTSVNTSTTTNPPSISTGKDYILAGYFNDSSSKAYVNNAATMAGNATVNPGSRSVTGLTIGTNNGYSPTIYFTGLISEVIIFNRPLQLQERKDVMSYLSKKYHIYVSGI